MVGSMRTDIAWVAALGLLVLAIACDSSEGPAESPAISVALVQVSSSTLRERVRGIGTLRASDRVEIRAEVPGIVREVHFEEGHFIEAGDLLYTLDDRKLRRELAVREASYTEATASLTEARAHSRRVERLHATQAISETEYDRATKSLHLAEAVVEGAAAAAQLLREQLRDTRITAPFSGPISESAVDAGDYVQVAEQLATMYALDNVEIAFRLPERYASRVAEGQSVEIDVASYPGRLFMGTLVFVAPAVDERTRDFLVKASVESPDHSLKPGSFATAEVIVQERSERPVVPEEALVPSRAGYHLFIVEDGIAWMRPVQLGLREPGRVEIIEGVVVGEWVVRAGHTMLSDGSRVRDIEAAPPLDDRAEL